MSSVDDAEKALYAGIKKVAESAVNYNGTTGSAMLRDVAIAYRAVYGGQQPGSVVVETK